MDSKTENLAQLLNYPLDSALIMRKKKGIKRSLLAQNSKFTEKRVAILGGSTTAEIKDILELFLLKAGIAPVFYESEYQKYYEDVILTMKS